VTNPNVLLAELSHKRLESKKRVLLFERNLCLVLTQTRVV